MSLNVRDRIYNQGTFTSPRRVLISSARPLSGGFSFTGAISAAGKKAKGLGSNLRKVLESEVVKDGKKILKELSGKSPEARKVLTAADFVSKLAGGNKVTGYPKLKGGITRQAREMYEIQPRNPPYRGRTSPRIPNGSPIGYTQGAGRYV